MNEREKMAISWIESPDYKGSEFDKTLVKLIRDGNLVFKFPDQFKITEQGKSVVNAWDKVEGR